eukprot:Pgem_evm1s14256
MIPDEDDLDRSSTSSCDKIFFAPEPEPESNENANPNISQNVNDSKKITRQSLGTIIKNNEVESSPKTDTDSLICIENSPKSSEGAKKNTVYDVENNVDNIDDNDNTKDSVEKEIEKAKEEDSVEIEIEKAKETEVINEDSAKTSSRW